MKARNGAAPRSTASENAIWGAQLEVGRAASSYIPTTSVPVTRSADSLTSSTAGWLRQGIGAILLSGASASAVLSGASGAYRAAVADGYFVVQNGGASTLLPVSGSTVAATYVAGACSSVSASGLRSGTPAAVPDLSLLTLTGKVRRFAYFPQHLSDDVLQGLARMDLSNPGVRGAPPLGTRAVVVSFLRDVSLGAGEHIVSGLGFRPSAVVFLAAAYSPPSGNGLSIGVGSTTGGGGIQAYDDPWTFASNEHAVALTLSAGWATADLTANGADGFTLTWDASAPVGSGVFRVTILCIK